MGKTCAAVNCTSGYRAHATPADVTFHKFPSDPGLCRKWLEKMHRNNFEPTNGTYLCSRHFEPDCFQSESFDSNSTRKQKTNDSGLRRRKLKPGAYPTIFDFTGHSYLQRVSPKKRKSDEITGASARKKLEMERNEDSVHEFLGSDRIKDFDELEKKLNEDKTVPPGFHFICEDDCLVIYLVEADAKMKMPVVKASIFIERDLKYHFSLRGKWIPRTEFSLHRINNRDKFQFFSELTHAMAEIKNMWLQREQPKPTTGELVDVATESLKEILETEDDVEFKKVIQFCYDQLNVNQKNVKGRRYSSDLLVFSCVLQGCSTAAYRAVRNSGKLLLPSESTLKNITKNVGQTADVNSDESYLLKRIEKLDENQKIVVLSVDEIYVSSRVEYDGARGVVTGFTDDGEDVKTVLVFHIHSILCDYQDTVALYPMNKLNEDKLRAAWDEVMKRLLRIGYQVVVVCADNLSVNRKFFRVLSGGQEIKSRIQNPHDAKKVLFLLLDPVHGFKNIYNCFQRRNFFKLPVIQGFHDHDSANFEHVRTLFWKEQGSYLKVARKLKKKALNPTNIERTSVQLALSVFHETTAAGLEAYGHEDVGWIATAKFIRLISNLFDIWNVRRPGVGVAKCNPYRGEITRINDVQIKFLEKFIEFLDSWHSSQWDRSTVTCLTQETFTAVRVACSTLIHIASYLLKDLQFKYVLLGKFNSDPIEKRFSWYRQLSGGDYYISVRQLLNSEKKIRVKLLFEKTGCNTEELKQIGQGLAVQVKESTLEHFVDAVADVLPEQDLSFNRVDVQSLFYVTGALLRSEFSLRKCDACQNILQSSQVMGISFVNEDGVVAENIAELHEHINRGGLLRPSMLAYGIGIESWKVYSAIDKNADVKSLATDKNLKKLFIETVYSLLQRDKDTSADVAVTTLICERGHDFVRSLAGRFFNCFQKNFVHYQTDLRNPEMNQKSLRKVAKLQSSQSQKMARKN